MVVISSSKKNIVFILSPDDFIIAPWFWLACIALKNVFFLWNQEKEMCLKHSTILILPVTKPYQTMHAICDCDTTSALFNQGKLKFLSSAKNKDLQPVMDPLTHLDESAEARNVFGLSWLCVGKNMRLDWTIWDIFILQK